MKGLGERVIILLIWRSLNFLTLYLDIFCDGDYGCSLVCQSEIISLWAEIIFCLLYYLRLIKSMLINKLQRCCVLHLLLQLLLLLFFIPLSNPLFDEVNKVYEAHNIEFTSRQFTKKSTELSLLSGTCFWRVICLEVKNSAYCITVGSLCQMYIHTYYLYTLLSLNVLN